MSFIEKKSQQQNSPNPNLLTAHFPPLRSKNCYWRHGQLVCSTFALSTLCCGELNKCTEIQAIVRARRTNPALCFKRLPRKISLIQFTSETYVNGVIIGTILNITDTFDAGNRLIDDVKRSCHCKWMKRQYSVIYRIKNRDSNPHAVLDKTKKKQPQCNRKLQTVWLLLLPTN